MSIKLYAIMRYYIENMDEKAPKEAQIEEKNTRQSFFELVRFALLALLIVLPIRFFVVEPFVVSGSSMFPAFNDTDYLIIDKISYKLGDPKRNDVVIFKYPKDKTKYFIKRVIGLPNETVDIKGNIVTITTADKKSLTLNEPYVKNIANNNTHVVLGDDEYFVMGDNRTASSDSRYWGAVHRELLVGRAFLRLLPLKNVDILPGAYERQVKE